jgi:hypothetical protein
VGFVANHCYVLYQIDTIDLNGIVITSELRLVSFLEKIVPDGYYFEIAGQTRFEIEHLKDSLEPIELQTSATVASINYVEVYNTIHEQTFCAWTGHRHCSPINRFGICTQQAIPSGKFGI